MAFPSAQLKLVAPVFHINSENSELSGLWCFFSPPLSSSACIIVAIIGKGR